ncbi:hypothetical protein [Halobellus limi]|uniref:Uncharacterized protein n=1 Tax=Halobellus limi TaxID=699433 RepID=A0A1H5SNJ7_9EURY|nr:hypothetical protein [Halobellus limi]QCC47536.1 hypothetical protein DV707_07595 [Halobellus limi]SEF52149.1 hypothetical protein SAMN04488133_0027 [Halobellus limi]
MTDNRSTTSGLSAAARVVFALVLVAGAIAPAFAGAATAAPDAGGDERRFQASDSDGPDWPIPFGNDNESSSDSASEPEGPPKTEFNASKLRQQGKIVSSRPSVRQFGPGAIWLRHVPTCLTCVDDAANHSRYVRPYTVVERDHVWIGGMLGWDVPDEDITVHVVTWRPKTVNYRTTEGNRTVVRSETIPANVTHNRVDVTLSGDGFFRKEVSLPSLYGEQRWVTMWIDGARWQTQWAFRMQVNPATASVPSSSIGDRIKWAVVNVGGITLITAIALLFVVKKALEKMGAVVIHPVEIAFATFVPTVPVVLLFWSGIVGSLAQRPQLIGALFGVFVATSAAWLIREKPEEWLFLKPSAVDAEIDEDGRGTWRWGNRAHKVIERDRDGRLAVPRPGWIPALARVWPFYDATPLLEFDAHRLDAHKLDSVPTDVEIRDDATALDQLKTRLVGQKSQDEYDEIVVVDPTAEHVIDHSGETLEIGLPELWSWPETEDDGVWIMGVPLPSIRFGLIAFGIAFIGVVTAFTTWFTTSAIWGAFAFFASILILVVHPATDTTAKVSLAPAHFDATIANMISTLEGYSEKATADHWRDRALEADAKRRVERANEAESQEMTKLRELADRIAPPAEDAGTNGTADERESYEIDTDGGRKGGRDE